MNERKKDLDTTLPSDGGSVNDDDVRELLEAAGSREPIPAAHLEAISSAARMAWKRQLHQREAVRTPWVPKLPALALAAMLALAVGLAGWWVWQGAATSSVARVAAVSGQVHLAGSEEGRWLEVGESIPLGGELVTGDEGGHAALHLGDSLHLRLDAGTRLRVASSGVVELGAGAVYIETGGDGRGGAGHQIEVRTPFGLATDIGTRFSVRLTNGERPGLDVQVRDGAVLTAQDGRTWRTEAGRQLHLSAAGEAAQAEIDPWGPEWEWVLAAAPGFDLEGKTLGEMLDWVARETGWQVELADETRAEAWRAIVLHGSFGPAGSRAARPDRVPFTVLPGAGLEGTLEDGKLVIRAAG